MKRTLCILEEKETMDYCISPLFRKRPSCICTS